MPLPSSYQAGGLTTSLNSLPAVNIANYTVDPNKIQQSLSSGINLGNQLSDEVILRPRQVQAAGALADAQTQEQINAGLAATSDRVNVPLRALNAGQVLQTQSTNNQIADVLAKSQALAVNDPGYLAKVVQGYKDHLATASAGAATERTLAEGDLANAPTVVGTNTEKVLTAKVASGGALERAPDQQNVQTTQAKLDKLHADQVYGVKTDPTIAAQDVQALKNQNTVATGTIERQAAPYSGPVQVEGVAGSRAADLNTSLTNRAALGNTIWQINGGGAFMMGKEEAVKLRDNARTAGVRIRELNGMLRPDADIERDYVRKMNLKEATEPLAAIRNEASFGAKAVTSFNAMQQLLPNAGTGFWQALPGYSKVNNILAAGGFEKPAVNQQMQAVQNDLAIDFQEKDGGHLRNTMMSSDYGAFKSSFPGIEKNAAVNKNLVKAGLIANTQLAQKANFFETLTPDLSFTKADQLWTQYQQANPLYDAANSKLGVIAFNETALTPNQYLEAIKNPQLAQRTGLQQAQAMKGSLPLANNTNPPTSPYVVDKGQIVPNPAYWAPIQAAHDQLPSAASAQFKGPTYKDSLERARLWTQSPSDFSGVPIQAMGAVPNG